MILPTMLASGLTLILVSVSTSFLAADPIVHSPWGTVRGIENVTTDYTMYHAFLGIPFALPPTGKRRFSRPEPHPGFNYIFNATTYGQACIQNLNVFGINAVIGAEDCLTLNIFTPVSHNEFSNLPVMVFVHGGGFQSGNAKLYDASPIVARGNVIMVIIQYRVGAFGFLSTADASAKGNYGLWDQNLAIQWVKKNIRSFGGDDNRITIIGDSTGAVGVAFQALYSGSKGLFQRIILQSGSVTSAWAYKRDPVNDSMVLAQRLNCLPSGKSDHAAMVHCLKGASARTLAVASWPMSNNPKTAIYDLGFIPTVDGEFIKDEPLTLINDQGYLRQIGLHNLDCMVSVTSHEGGGIMSLNKTIFSSNVDISYYKQYLITGVLLMYFGASTTTMVNAVASENIPSGNHGNTVDPEVLADTTADPNILVPQIVFARAHAQLIQSTHSQKKTYMYLFDHTPSFLDRPEKGMLHAEDIYFIFGLTREFIQSLNFFTPSKGEPTQGERELSNSVMDFLTDFARDGNPSPAVSFKLQGDWPEFTMPDENYLHLDTNMSIDSHPYSSRMTLWTKTLPMLLRNWNQHNTSTQKPNPGVIG